MPTRPADPVPFRVLTFLDAVARSESIREALAASGYSRAEDDWAWQRVVSVAGYRIKAGEAGANADAAQALVELDNIGTSFFARVAAALAQAADARAFVLTDVDLHPGADAVFAIALVLERLQALEVGREGDATRGSDRSALDKLEARGLGASERQRLGALVARALPWSEPPAAAGEPLDNQRRASDLRALRRWYEEWSTTARAVLKRRHQLERLGLRRLRAPARTEAGASAPAPSTIAPPRGNGGRGGPPE